MVSSRQHCNKQHRKKTLKEADDENEARGSCQTSGQKERPVFSGESFVVEQHVGRQHEREEELKRSKSLITSIFM